MAPTFLDPSETPWDQLNRWWYWSGDDMLSISTRLSPVYRSDPISPGRLASYESMRGDGVLLSIHWGVLGDSESMSAPIGTLWERIENEASTTQPSAATNIWVWRVRGDSTGPFISRFDAESNRTPEALIAALLNGPDLQDEEFEFTVVQRMLEADMRIAGAGFRVTTVFPHKQLTVLLAIMLGPPLLLGFLVLVFRKSLARDRVRGSSHRPG